MSFDGRALLAEVKANTERLEQCVLHQFQPMTPGLFGTKYICIGCGGSVDGVSARWYARGIEHGKTSTEGRNA